MSRLLSLPPEILLKIIDAVLPSDLENFCLCCKGLEALAEDALKRHASMKAKCSKLNCGRHWNDDNHLTGHHHHPITILRAILEDDRYAHYPRALEIGCFEFENPSNASLPQVLSTMKELEDKILALLSESLYLNDGNMVNEWRIRIESGNGDSCAALIISLLPNLQSMVVSGFYSEDCTMRGMKNMLNSIAKSSHEPSLAKPLALSKLSQVGIDGTEEVGQEELEFVEAFAALPSMRRINGIFICQESFRSKFKSQTSGVEEIVFEESTISASSFGELFGLFKALRKFKYEAVPPKFGMEWICDFWEPHQIVAALLRRARHSLEELDIVFGNRNYIFNRSSSEKFIGSLRSFEILRHIRVEPPTLFPYFIWYDGTCNYVEGEDEEEGKEEDEDFAPAPLVEILPASVETLVVCGEISRSKGTKLFRGLASLRESRLPKLRAVNFEYVDEVPVDEETRAICRDCGITLSCSSDHRAMPQFYDGGPK